MSVHGLLGQQPSPLIGTAEDTDVDGDKGPALATTASVPSYLIREFSVSLERVLRSLETRLHHILPRTDRRDIPLASDFFRRLQRKHVRERPRQYFDRLTQGIFRVAVAVSLSRRPPL
jgi:hypothetical protein